MPTPEKIVKNINNINPAEIDRTKTPQRNAYIWALHYKGLDDKERVSNWKQYLKDEKKIAKGRKHTVTKTGGKGSRKSIKRPRSRNGNKTKRMPRM